MIPAISGKLYIIYSLFMAVIIPFQQSPMRGEASYYADKFEGKKTASGEAYKASELTAAHRSLPFGTMVKVTNLSNNNSTIVRINDRGPHVKKRIIDVSKAAAQELDFIEQGVTIVEIEVIDP
jgi:rare lipoprotein A